MALREFEIIRSCFRDSGLGFQRSGVALGIGDDCALLELPAGQQLAVSLDMLQEGVHFPEAAPPEQVGYRALAVNLSDLAACGAEPWCFTLGLSIPDAEPAWLSAFNRGLLEIARLHNCPLVGGDLIRGRLNIAIQVQGLVPKGQALLRSTASPGDLVYVTGTLGDAAVGLTLLPGAAAEPSPWLTDGGRLTAAHREFFITRFYRPQPRIRAGILMRRMASACIDISDGLLGDLGHIVEDSGVGAVLDVEQLPWSEAMLASLDPTARVSAALFGGDDYELCFTVPPQRRQELEQVLVLHQIPFRRIGEITGDTGIKCLDRRGKPVPTVGSAFSHFREA